MGNRDVNSATSDFPEGEREANLQRKEEEKKEPFSLSRDGRCITGEERLLRGRLCTEDPSITSGPQLQPCKSPNHQVRSLM